MNIAFAGALIQRTNKYFSRTLIKTQSKSVLIDTLSMARIRRCRECGCMLNLQAKNRPFNRNITTVGGQKRRERMLSITDEAAKNLTRPRIPSSTSDLFESTYSNFQGQYHKDREISFGEKKLTWEAYTKSHSKGEIWTSPQYNLLFKELAAHQHYEDILSVLKDIHNQKLDVTLSEYEEYFITILESLPLRENIPRVYYMFKNFINSDPKACRSVSRRIFQTLLKHYINIGKVRLARSLYDKEIAKLYVMGEPADQEILEDITEQLLKAEEVENLRETSHKVIEHEEKTNNLIHWRIIGDVVINLDNRNFTNAFEGMRKLSKLEGPIPYPGILCVSKIIRRYRKQGEDVRMVLQLIEEYRRLKAEGVDIVQWACLVGPLLDQVDKADKSLSSFEDLWDAVVEGDPYKASNKIASRDKKLTRRLLEEIILTVYARFSSSDELRRMLISVRKGILDGSGCNNFYQISSFAYVDAIQNILSQQNCNSSLYDKITQLYQHMRVYADHPFPSEKLHFGMIHHYLQNGKLELAYEWHNRLISDGALPSANATYLLVQKLIESDDIDAAFLVYCSTVRAIENSFTFSSPPPLPQYSNVSLSSSSLLHLPVLTPIEPFDKIYTALILAFVHRNDISRLRYLLDDMIRLHHAGRGIISNALLQIYLQQGKEVTAMNIFDEMTSPDVATYTILMHHFIQAGSWRKNGSMSFALQACELILHDMIACKISPDLVLLSVLLNAHAKNGDIKSAETILEEIRKMRRDGNDDNSISDWRIVLNTVVDAYAEATDPDGAAQLIAREFAVGPNEGKKGMPLPDAYTYTTLIKALSKKSPRMINMLKAERVFANMLTLQINPTIETLIHLLGGYLECKATVSARRCFQIMMINGVDPDERCWRRLLGSSSKYADIATIIWVVKTVCEKRTKERNEEKIAKSTTKRALQTDKPSCLTSISSEVFVNKVFPPLTLSRMFEALLGGEEVVKRARNHGIAIDEENLLSEEKCVQNMLKVVGYLKDARVYVPQSVIINVLTPRLAAIGWNELDILNLFQAEET